MKARTIKAIFEISEDSNLSGVEFKVGRTQIQWEDMTNKEQVKMLNAWGGMYKLFYNCYVENEKDLD